VDLPTYTNIWRIEKRLYKLYDFRLPAPLPITWIGVFAGITVPYVFFLVAIGLPFNHNLVWLYVLPPGVLTWLTTRPVIESKRLPELVGSQLRYLSEPRTWCRLAPFAEKDDIFVSVRVWHRHPRRARPKATRKAATRARQAEKAQRAPAAAGSAAPVVATSQVAAPQAAARQLPARQVPARQVPARQVPARQVPAPQPSRPAVPHPSWTSAPLVSQPAEPPVSWSDGPSAQLAPLAPPPAPPAVTPMPVPQRATAQPEVRRARAARPRAGAPEPEVRPPAPADEPQPGVIQRPAWAVAPSDRRQESRALEVSHDPEPDPRDLWEPRPASFAPAAWPTAGPVTFPVAGAFPEVGPFPEVGAFPEVGPYLEPDAADFAAAQADADSAAEVDVAVPVSPVPTANAVPGAAEVQEAGAAEPGAEATAPAAEVSPASEVGPVLELEPLPDPDLSVAFRPAPPAQAPASAAQAPAPPAQAPASAAPLTPAPFTAAPPPPVTRAPAPPAPPHVIPRRATPVPATPGRSVAPKVAARVVDLDGNRAVPSVERALSGPASQGEASWRRRVKVVTGGQGPGQRDQEALDRDRARQPLAGPRRIAVLGCTGGAGQTVTAMMAGHVLADLRDEPVAALDLNPGDSSLTTRIAPVTSVSALLAGGEPDARTGEDAGSGPARRGPAVRLGRGRPVSRLDVIAAGPPGTDGPQLLGADDYQRLTRRLAARYLLTMIDLAPSGLTRVLPLADQLVLVAPASPEAATSLANTLQWLTAHGYDELAARAVTVVNGVSRRSMEDVLRAESVARGRGRAILRVPWDDLLSAWPDSSAKLQPQTRLAYTALAGLLVAGLNPKDPKDLKDPNAADPRTPVPGRSAGEHSD
jgi:MinD-like ATPase involved in chromosome partitioning or flagellar assembly